jgi:hypothetical protein
VIITSNRWNIAQPSPLVPRDPPGGRVIKCFTALPERAQQIRRISRLYRPFRAWDTFCFPYPGRCPGLICFGPFRAEKPRALHFVSPNSATSKSASEGRDVFPRSRFGLVS